MYFNKNEISLSKDDKDRIEDDANIFNSNHS